MLFHTLADSIPQMIWMCTPDGLNIYFSQQWVDYTGLTLRKVTDEVGMPPFIRTTNSLHGTPGTTRP